MKPQRSLLCDIVLWLLNRQENWLRNYASRIPLGLHEQVAQRYQRICDGQLLGQAKTRTQFSSRRQFIFLPPIEKEGWIQPILWMAYDFGEEVPKLSLQVGLFGLSGNAKDPLVALPAP